MIKILKVVFFKEVNASVNLGKFILMEMNGQKRMFKIM
jgi:hypothetical protein